MGRGILVSFGGLLASPKLAIVYLPEYWFNGSLSGGKT